MAANCWRIRTANPDGWCARSAGKATTDGQMTQLNMKNKTQPKVLLCRNTDREKFEEVFTRSFPMPRSRAQRGNWKFKRETAWWGWRAARGVPYVAPRCTATMAVMKTLTPEDIMSLSKADKTMRLSGSLEFTDFERRFMEKYKQPWP
jgi:hypothetical protein